MMNTLPALLISVLSFSEVFAKILRTNCIKEGSFTNTLLDKALQNHVIRSLTTSSAIDCAFHCIPDQRCLSYNYAPALQSCQLNNETVATKPVDLKSRAGTHYYDTGASSYCQNGGTPQGQCLRHQQVLCFCTPRWTGDDCSIPKLGAANTTAGESCRSVKNAGDSVGDASYWMKPPGVLSAFNVNCWMSNLGVWTRVTASMLHSVKKSGVTITTGDVNGGLQVSGSVTDNGCGGGRTGSASIVYIEGYWTKIKYKQEFRGVVSCWRIFGNTDYSNHGNGIGYINHGLLAFNSSQDTITDQYYMHGQSGHAFDGSTVRCDNVGSNFWDYSGVALRYATVTLRRNDTVPLAGIITATSCGTPTYIIKEIYVYH